VAKAGIVLTYTVAVATVPELGVKVIAVGVVVVPIQVV
jgi:hypothetical protein